MNILPNAILALRNGTATPPSGGFGFSPGAAAGAGAGAGAPLPSAIKPRGKKTETPAAAAAAAPAPAPAIRPTHRTKREIAAAERRAAIRERIKALVESKPSKKRVSEYMRARVAELAAED